MNEDFSLPFIEYRAQRVLTTAHLASACGVTEQEVLAHFYRNSDKYQEGKHYLCIPDQTPLYLWTEQGALLLAKPIETDAAWRVYEHLVDCIVDARHRHQDAQRGKNHVSGTRSR